MTLPNPARARRLHALALGLVGPDALPCLTEQEFYEQPRWVKDWYRQAVDMGQHVIYWHTLWAARQHMKRLGERALALRVRV